MRLYTARYANRALAEHPAAKFGISLGVPKWPLPYRLHQLRELAPAGWMLPLEEPEFAIAYTSKLDRLGASPIQIALELAGNHGAAVLLCWEDLTKPGVWCHRRILAAWLEQQTGEPVDELDDGPEQLVLDASKP
jgi:hypothetical protein